MAKFTDKLNREWSVVLDVNQLKVVRERCEFKLGDLLTNNMAGLNQLASDPELLVRVLFVLCEKQAKTESVTPEEFGRSITGDAIQDAFDALMGAYADFCPSRQAQPLRALLAKNKELEAAATGQALEAIAKLDPLEILRNSPGNAAESAGSIPVPVG